MLAFEMLTPIAVTGKPKIGGGDPEVSPPGSAAVAARLYPAVPCYAEGQAICGFSHREVPPMSPTPEIGAG